MSELDEAAESSPAEGSNGESTLESSGGTLKPRENTENMVPQSRFNEVINERNAAREELGGFRTRIEQLEAVIDENHEPKLDTGGASPPEGLSKEKEIEWWVKKYSPSAESVVEKRLGMSLDEVARRLELSESTAKESQGTRWRLECDKFGLDPNDRDVQGVASGLAQAYPEKDLQSVLASTAKLVGVNKKSQERPGANVERGGVSGVMASPDWVPKNSEDASEGAKQGRRAKHRSTVEIIEAGIASRRSQPQR